MEHIKHVFFDLDNTLWDFEKNSALAYAKIFEENEIYIDLQKFLGYYKAINNRYWKLYRDDKISKEAMRYRRLNDVFKVMKRPASSSLINHLSKEYTNSLVTYSNLFSGAIDTLGYLSPKYKLHILTNGFEEIQSRKLKAAAIDSYFETVICSDVCGSKKPNPKMYQYAIDAIDGAEKHNSIMIGDCLEADVVAANKFGIDAIYCNYNDDKKQKKVKSINSLKELRQYL